MALLGINTGTMSNDGTGDPIRVAMGKINSNFKEIYETIGNGTSLSSYVSASGISSLSKNLTNNPVISVSGILNTGITTTEHLEVTNIKSSGIVTAVQFVGDGSQLSNVTSTKSGIDVLDDNVRRGVARELNFGERIITTGPDQVGRVTIAVDSYVPSSGISSYATNSGTSIISGYANSCGVSSSLKFSNVSVGASSDTLTIGIGSQQSIRLQSNGIVNSIRSSGILEIDSFGSGSNPAYINLSNQNVPLRIYKKNNSVSILVENDISTDIWYFTEYGAIEFPDGSEQFTAFTGYSETSGISTLSEGLIGNPNLNVGVITATKVFGDGSGLTGIIATGTGIEIKNNSVLVGVANTIDFSQNLSATVSSGIATITVSGIVPYSNVSGISTVSSGLTGIPNINVGVISATSVSVASSVTSKSLNVSNIRGKIQTIVNTDPVIDLSSNEFITGRIIRITSSQECDLILPPITQENFGLEIIFKNFGPNTINIKDYFSTVSLPLLPAETTYIFNDGQEWTEV